MRHPRRDALQAALHEAGVETVIHYPVAPHLQPAYAGLGIVRGSLPVAERLQAEVLSLPIGPHLSVDDVRHVCREVRHALEQIGTPADAVV